MTENMHKLLAAVAAGSIGFLTGWSAQALTLTGRVQAIEAGQARIEARLDQLVRQEKGK